MTEPTIDRPAAEYVVVMTTCPNQAEAEELASQLVRLRLAACVQTNQIHSTYRWKEAIEQAEEVRLMIKARAVDYAAIEAHIRSSHSYETPEIIAIPVAYGSKPYLAWMEQETLRP